MSLTEELVSPGAVIIPEVTSPLSPELLRRWRQRKRLCTEAGRCRSQGRLGLELIRSAKARTGLTLPLLRYSCFSAEEIKEVTRPPRPRGRTCSPAAVAGTSGTEKKALSRSSRFQTHLFISWLPWHQEGYRSYTAALQKAGRKTHQILKLLFGCLCSRLGALATNTKSVGSKILNNLEDSIHLFTRSPQREKPACVCGNAGRADSVQRLLLHP